MNSLLLLQSHINKMANNACNWLNETAPVSSITISFRSESQQSTANLITSVAQHNTPSYQVISLPVVFPCVLQADTQKHTHTDSKKQL